MIMSQWLIIFAFLYTVRSQDFGSLNEIEYQAFILTNAARMNPEWYSKRFSPSYSCSTKNEGPLGFNQNLFRSARFHSDDMFYHGCFDHSDCSCSGSHCDFSSRIGRFEPSVSVKAENIAQGANSAVDLINMWLNSAAHCENIFGDVYNQMGMGISSNLATQDLAAGNPPSSFVGGVYISGLFLAIATGSLSPQLILNGKVIEMKNEGFGLYSVETTVSRCSQYQFLYEGNNFPSGSLQAGCESFYSESAGAITSAPAPAPIHVSAPAPAVSKLSSNLASLVSKGISFAKDFVKFNDLEPVKEIKDNQNSSRTSSSSTVTISTATASQTSATPSQTASVTFPLSSSTPLVTNAPVDNPLHFDNQGTVGGSSSPPPNVSSEDSSKNTKIVAGSCAAAASLLLIGGFLFFRSRKTSEDEATSFERSKDLQTQASLSMVQPKSREISTDMSELAQYEDIVFNNTGYESYIDKYSNYPVDEGASFAMTTRSKSFFTDNVRSSNYELEKPEGLKVLCKTDTNFPLMEEVSPISPGSKSEVGRTMSYGSSATTIRRDQETYSININDSEYGTIRVDDREEFRKSEKFVYSMVFKSKE